MLYMIAHGNIQTPMETSRNLLEIDYVLYEIFWNFTNIATKLGYYDYISNVSKKFKSVYRCYKIFSFCVSDFTDMTKVFKQPTTHYINK